MKKLIAILSIWLALAIPALAVNVNIDGLPAATSVAGTDLLECEQGGVNNKCTPAQAAAYVYGLMSGDATASGTGGVTLATVNANVGSFGSATTCTAFTTNGKGLITAASAVTCTPAIASVTGLGTGVGTALGVNIGTAGSFVVNGGALGTPSSGVGTNLTGTAAGLTAGTVTTNANLTGDVTSAGNATTYANVVPAAKGGAGTITGALKGNGSGTVSQAACADLSNATALCSTPPGTGVATAAAANLSAAGGLTSTIASGTAALGTGAISSATCATAVTVAATNVATTDTVTASFNGDPTAVTGYVPATTGMLTIIGYPTAGNVNFKVCNNTASSITPGTITLNWRVVR